MEVYDSAGYDGLRNRSYSELSVFDLDAIGAFDDFFEALNPLTGVEDAEIKESAPERGRRRRATRTTTPHRVVVRNGSSQRREDPGILPAAASSQCGLIAPSRTVMESETPVPRATHGA